MRPLPRLAPLPAVLLLAACGALSVDQRVAEPLAEPATPVEARVAPAPAPVRAMLAEGSPFPLLDPPPPGVVYPIAIHSAILTGDPPEPSILDEPAQPAEPAAPAPPARASAPVEPSRAGAPAPFCTGIDCSSVAEACAPPPPQPSGYRGPPLADPGQIRAHTIAAGDTWSHYRLRLHASYPLLAALNGLAEADVATGRALLIRTGTVFLPASREVTRSGIRICAAG